MNYKIIGDSCCDYSEYSSGLSWLKRIPLTISLKGKQFIDNEELDCLGLISEMKMSLEPPKSACPSPGLYLEAFEGNFKDVYVVTLSAKLSGSYNSAMVAKKMYLEHNKNKNIYVFNSKSAAAGQVAICLKIKELADKGLSFEEVVIEVEKFIQEMTTLFVLEDLDVLRKNGRLTHLQSIITGTLKIKMVMAGESDGTIGVRGKAITTSGALKKMVDIIKKKCEDAQLKERLLVITHCNCLEKANKLKEQIMSFDTFKEAVICRAGGISTIYANSGGIIVSF